MLRNMPKYVQLRGGEACFLLSHACFFPRRPVPSSYDCPECPGDAPLTFGFPCVMRAQSLVYLAGESIVWT